MAQYLTTRFESILEQLSSKNPLPVHGVSTSAAIAFLISRSFNIKFRAHPQIIVTPTHQQAEKLRSELLFFDPTLAENIFLMPEVSLPPYSGNLAPRTTGAKRSAWLYQALTAPEHKIFIAPAAAIMLKTLPKDVFSKNQKVLTPGDEVDEHLLAWLQSVGYVQAEPTEDIGSYSLRRHIFDIFSPASKLPYRIELFGDQIDQIKLFDPTNQRSLGNVEHAVIAPAAEVILDDVTRPRALQELDRQNINHDELKHALITGHSFQGLESILPLLYENLVPVLSYFNWKKSETPNLWFYHQMDCLREADKILQEFKEEQRLSSSPLTAIAATRYTLTTDQLFKENFPSILQVDPVELKEASNMETATASYPTKKPPLNNKKSEQINLFLKQQKGLKRKIFIGAATQVSAQRAYALLERLHFKPKICTSTDTDWDGWALEQENSSVIHILQHEIPESFILVEDQLVVLKDRDLLDHHSRLKSTKSSSDRFNDAKAFNFGELRTGDPIVHNLHGVGIYEGLKTLELNGSQGEFLQLKYKDNDRLYVPVYKLSSVYKFSAPFHTGLVDKLGGNSFEKAQVKVKSHLREVAAELLKLYAERAQSYREPLPAPGKDYEAFENDFPFAETEDQLQAITDILADFSQNKPMDRLICGDVGFGKTEVAMRASFFATHAGKQVAVLVPTTTLVLQHFENFKKRFKNWPIKIASLSRFTSSKDAKKTIAELKRGQVDILIGTHRLLSKDIEYKDLGLIVVDEEQRFGVLHKERLKKLRAHVDTLTLSATPIPRTLNMSLMGVRDLSLINTAPKERLPIRTYLVKESDELIRKSIQSELARGGQVLFVHNRVQSISEVAERIQRVCPEVRVRIGHGQMKESDLEDVIISFFKHEFDVLLCTTIIESGMDIPRANTMIVDHAEMFGLSQLYQLRGRVGRGNERAYCYLMIPQHGIDELAQERLKVLQENTELGSGLRIAQYDMEMRGAGDILGESQSGHANMVGHDLYFDLLQEALAEAQGISPQQKKFEPEVNIRIPAFIPDEYMPDIRMRLSFYKLLSEATSLDEVDQIEADLRDRFGPLPVEVVNFLGVIMIKKLCQELGIKDLSTGPKNLILSFSEFTTISVDKLIMLATQHPKKYRLQPNNKLLLPCESGQWNSIFEKLSVLKPLLLY